MGGGVGLDWGSILEACEIDGVTDALMSSLGCAEEVLHWRVFALQKGPQRRKRREYQSRYHSGDHACAEQHPEADAAAEREVEVEEDDHG
ncbi:MAG: hypothetical protein Q9159_005400 [Coniocarpon cinnabarinum]